MNLDQLFGELRALIQAPQSPCSTQLLALLKIAFSLDPQRYQEQWIPYLTTFALPPFEVRSLEELTVADKLFPEHLTGIFRTQKGLFQDVYLLDVGVRELARQPALRRLREIELSRQYFSNEGMIALSQSPHLHDNVQRLDVSYNKIGVEGVSSIAQCAAFEHLSVLSLDYNRLTDACVNALSTSSMSSLTQLGLHNAQITEESVFALARAPFASSLRQLSLSRTGIGSRGIVALVQSSESFRFSTLKLGMLSIDHHDVQSLVKAPLLESVSRLDLWMNELDHHCMRIFAASPRLTQLRHLDISDNDVGDGLKWVMTSEHLEQLECLHVAANYLWDTHLACLAQATSTQLHTLGLQENLLTMESMAYVARASWATSLRVLNLGDNELGELGAHALGQIEQLHLLASLDLSTNSLGDAGVRGLVTSPYLTHLQHLVLDHNALTTQSAMDLARCANMASLKTLSLREGEVDDEGLLALAQSPYLSGLTCLDLSQNDISDDAVMQLLRSSVFARGTMIRLEDTGCLVDEVVVGSVYE